MSEYKLTPYGDLASTTDEGKAILASLTDKERQDANINSRVLYGGRNVDELDLQRLKAIWKGVQFERRNPAPNTCWQCGRPAPGSECRPCHEGIAPHRYQRAMAGIFLSPPAPLPRMR